MKMGHIWTILFLWFIYILYEPYFMVYMRTIDKNNNNNNNNKIVVKGTNFHILFSYQFMGSISTIFAFCGLYSSHIYFF